MKNDGEGLRMSNRMGGGGMGPPDAQDGFVECKPAIVRKCGTGHFVKGCVHVRDPGPKSLKNGDHRLVLPLCRSPTGSIASRYSDV